jgi:hypothetical protein
MDRLAIHDALREQLNWFAGAHAGLHADVKAMLGDNTGDRADVVAREVHEVMSGLGLSLSELSDRTGLTMGRLLDLSRPGAVASPEEIAAIGAVTGAVIEDINRYSSAAAALTAASQPAWRTARRRWTSSRFPDAYPDDPTLLVSDLLERPMAARTIAGVAEADEAERRLERYWRDQVAMALQEYR